MRRGLPGLGLVGVLYALDELVRLIPSTVSNRTIRGSWPRPYGSLVPSRVGAQAYGVGISWSIVVPDDIIII